MSGWPGKNPWVALAILVVVFAGARLWSPESDGPGMAAGGDIDALFAAGRGDTWVEAEGVIEAVLRDDTRGSQHQRLIVALPSGLTVLIAHNIDLAPRVQGVRRGQPIAFRGEYEWNDKGGVVHWTHHDPDGDHPGGWIDYRGTRYR